MYLLLLPESQTDDLLNFPKEVYFGNRRALDRKLLSLFEYTQVEMALYEDTAY